MAGSTSCIRPRAPCATSWSTTLAPRRRPSVTPAASAGKLIAWGYDGYQQVSKAPKSLGFVQVDMGSNWGAALNAYDCNGNGVHDSEDISAGTSLDCNANGVPDECDLLVYGGDIDGDGQLDDCVHPPLMADSYEVSVATGGVQSFLLTAPVALDKDLLLGTTSGTAPGTLWDSTWIPLNTDTYMVRTAFSPNAPPLSNSFGTLAPLAPGGTATAAFTLPPALDPVLVGLTLHHAYVTLDAVSGGIAFVSNAVPLVLKP